MRWSRYYYYNLIIAKYPFHFKPSHCKQFNIISTNKPLSSTLWNETAQVTTFTILHYDVYCCVAFVHYTVIVAYNVLVSELSQEIHLGNQQLFLRFWHRSIVHFLPYQYLQYGKIKITLTINILNKIISTPCQWWCHKIHDGIVCVPCCVKVYTYITCSSLPFT